MKTRTANKSGPDTTGANMASAYADTFFIREGLIAAPLALPR